jgi:deoxyribose-phosphate aldolase
LQTLFFMLNLYIDHTILSPTASKADIAKLCQEAIQHQFFGVCVAPTYLELAKIEIEKSNIKLVTVIGFPFGYNTTASKMEDARQAIISGANEIDVVINLTHLLNGQLALIKTELSELRAITKDANVALKLIIESGILTNSQIVSACEIANYCNVDFIKTSTGYAAVSATENAVKLINQYKLPNIQVKASGGIRTKAQAQAYIDLGVTRIGTSNGVQIMNEQQPTGTY